MPRPDQLRIPQPATDDGADMAANLWKRRRQLIITRNEGDKSYVNRIEMTPTLNLRIDDQTHIQYAMETRASHREHGSCFVWYSSVSANERGDKACWLLHAWRAAQACRILAALGCDADVGDAPLCVRTPRPYGKAARLAMRAIDMLRVSRRPTAAEVLEARLDAEIARRLAAMPAQALLERYVDVGGGVSVDGSLYEPILAIHHAEHGTMSLAGEAAILLNARLDELRADDVARLTGAGTGEAGRLSRVMEICREAVAVDPEMTDDAGTPIRPLLDEHLPRLARRLDEALSSSSPEQRDEIHREVAEALERVTAAVAEGMATRARIDRDSLRTELRFLTTRHRDQDV